MRGKAKMGIETATLVLKKAMCLELLDLYIAYYEKGGRLSSEQMRQDSGAWLKEYQRNYTGSKGTGPVICGFILSFLFKVFLAVVSKPEFMDFETYGTYKEKHPRSCSQENIEVCRMKWHALTGNIVTALKECRKRVEENDRVVLSLYTAVSDGRFVRNPGILVETILSACGVKKIRELSSYKCFSENESINEDFTGCEQAISYSIAKIVKRSETEESYPWLNEQGKAALSNSSGRIKLWKCLLIAAASFSVFFLNFLIVALIDWGYCGGEFSSWFNWKKEVGLTCALGILAISVVFVLVLIIRRKAKASSAIGSRWFIFAAAVLGVIVCSVAEAYIYRGMIHEPELNMLRMALILLAMVSVPVCLALGEAHSLAKCPDYSPRRKTVRKSFRRCWYYTALVESIVSGCVLEIPAFAFVVIALAICGLVIIR